MHWDTAHATKRQARSLTKQTRRSWRLGERKRAAITSTTNNSSNSNNSNTYHYDNIRTNNCAALAANPQAENPDSTIYIYICILPIQQYVYIYIYIYIYTYTHIVIYYITDLTSMITC